MSNASTLGAMSPGLLKVVERARREPEGRFHSLAHRIDVPALRRAYDRMRKDAAVGVDGMTKDRYGQYVNQVRSLLIRCGEADVLYAGEQLEALRYAHHLEPGGRIVMDDRVIRPIRLAADAPPYPENVAEFLRGKGYRVMVCSALDLAVELGEKRCANVILLGLFSRQLELSHESWQAALEKRFPKQYLDLNRRAFQTGREARVE